METKHLTVNQLSPEGFAWYLRYLAALDAKDLPVYAGFLADDCEFYLNNLGPIQGKSAIVALLGQYWPTFRTLRHDLLTILGSDRHFMLEALNHYTRLDGSPVTLRAVAITIRNEAGLVISARIYTDTTPLFSPGA